MDQDKDGSWSLPGIPRADTLILSSFITSQWDWKAVDGHLNLVSQKRQHASLVNATLNHFSVGLSALLIAPAPVVQQKCLPKLVSLTFSLKELQGHGARLPFGTNLPRNQLCVHTCRGHIRSQCLGPSPLQSPLWKPLSLLLVLSISQGVSNRCTPTNKWPIEELCWSDSALC